MPEFRSRPDGTVYPLTPKKGGAGGLLLLILFAVIALGAGGGLDKITKSTGSDATTGVREASADHHSLPWSSLGWRLQAHAVSHDRRCAQHAFGQVKTFLIESPCDGLDRVLLAVHDANGSSIVITVAWIRMPSSTAARRLESLADSNGTGNILPLASSIGGLSGFRFGGNHYHSTVSGNTVVIAEAAPVSGGPDTATLDTAARLGTEFPHP